MLVFDFLKCRKFRDLGSKAKQKTVLRVCLFFPGVRGFILPSHTKWGIYIHTAWVSLFLFNPDGNSYNHRK
jgi:hypothetical protein